MNKACYEKKNVASFLFSFHIMGNSINGVEIPYIESLSECMNVHDILHSLKNI